MKTKFSLPAVSASLTRATTKTSTVPGTARRLRPHGGWQHAGFTMIEITLAIGIVAFAFVATYSLLPLGMQTFHRSMENSVGSNIAQLLINEAQQTDFNTLTANPDTPKPVRYFDEQGTEHAKADDMAVIYHVNTRVLATTTFPGTPASNASIATVTIQIAHNPANLPLTMESGTLLWAPSNRQPIVTCPVLVSRNK